MSDSPPDDPRPNLPETNRQPPQTERRTKSILGNKARKPEIPSEQPKRADGPLTEAQIQISEWFAWYKRITFPTELIASRNKWWAWINAKVTQIDREDAHAIRMDYGLGSFDLSDPIEVIGKLRYAAEAERTSPLESAKNEILKGTHPYTAQEQYNLTDRQLEVVVKSVHKEDPHFEIDWGSV